MNLFLKKSPERNNKVNYEYPKNLPTELNILVYLLQCVVHNINQHVLKCSISKDSES